LWEEIRSSDLFWNRFWFVRALNMGASFAQQQGDQATAAKYTSLAKTINDQLVSGHYNGQYLFEDKSRTMDGGVIVALNDAYDGGLFSPSSSEVAGTILSYNKLFCNEYAINQQDNKNGIPGMLYGRYGGDVYAGGNPWVLTTAALARLYYRAAKEVVTMNALPSKDALSRWAQILSVDESRLAATSPKDLAAMLSEAGDAVLVRLRYHVAGDGFHLAEQLDRDKGFAKSAADLTWSYAETLKAMTEREQVSALLQASPVITLN
jgi:glucoamylase